MGITTAHRRDGMQLFSACCFQMPTVDIVNAEPKFAPTSRSKTIAYAA